MKLCYRIKTFFRYAALAFYPKATLVACIVVAIVIGAVMGVALLGTERGTVAYDILLAVLTGIAASLFVAVVVELTANYRHNRLALHELGDYYQAIITFNTGKRIYMRGLGASLDEGSDEDADEDDLKVNSTDLNLTEDEPWDADDAPQDAVQATWELLPELEPLMSQTLAGKKTFLTEREISRLKQIAFSYSTIRHEVIERLRNHANLGYNGVSQK